MPDTGLSAEEVAGLDDRTAKVLAVWHMARAGDDDGTAWFPAAIRRMPLESRLRLARDPMLDAAWERSELERCRHPETGPHYFVESYGHVQPEEGEPIPFSFWPRQVRALQNAIGARDQGEVLDMLIHETRVVILKARQLGMTWLAIHFAVWALLFDPRFRRARVLALSKHGGDATKLLQRARRVCKLLPAFMRPSEDPETARNLSRFKIRGGGEIVSLAGTPEAARGETSALAIVDEYAHIRNQNAGPTWAALQPTLGQRGRVIVIFTGNGPAEVAGDGQAAAVMWQRARSGESSFRPVFLPTSTHPERDRDKYRAEFLTDEDWQAEYPENEDEALVGKQGMKVYSPGGINAAEEIGRAFDLKLAQGIAMTEDQADTHAPPPAGEGLGITWDFGERTHGLILWPLEQGGFHVAAEVAPELPQEVEQSTQDMLDTLAALQDGLGEFAPLVAQTFYDAAGIQSLRTYRNVVARPENLRRFAHRIINNSPRVLTTGVPFAKFKSTGSDYLKRLFNRSAAGEEVNIISISPRCRVLLRELRSLEIADEETGRIKKGNDHGPDALIAGVVPTALEFLGRDFDSTAGQEAA